GGGRAAGCSCWSRRLGGRDGRLLREDVVFGYVGKAQHAAAVDLGERFGLAALAEGHGVFGAHAADVAAFDDVVGLAGVDPGGGVGFASEFGAGHVVDVDGEDGLGFFGQYGVGEYLLDGRDPYGGVAPLQEDLA